MFKKMYILLMVLVFMCGGSLLILAGEEDVAGSKDHPVISRYEGSTIVAYEQFAYDRLALVAGMGKEEIEETVVEGEVTRIVYKGPEGRSALEIYRNYQMALKEAGFEIVYECADDHDKAQKMVPEDINGFSYYLTVRRGRDGSYFLARLADSEGDIYVSVHIGLDRDQLPHTALQVVEEKPMETGKVEVDLDPGTMSQNIDEKGSVRIYGIHFDTDKATIKQKSESTLETVATFLQQEPDLTLGVIGHTDATGPVEYNMALSQERAKAVVDFLITEHEVDEDRLTPHGVGPLAPVASNEEEEGRAQNRRVELIKMLEE